MVEGHCTRGTVLKGRSIGGLRTTEPHGDFRDGRGGLVGKSTGSYSVGSGFDSQHPRGSSQPPDYLHKVPN